jgi:hypothetical protein
MKKIIKLTETDLTRIVKRVLSESDNCEEDYKNFECPKGTIRGESVGYTNVCSTAQIMAQNNWMKSKGLSSYNFSNIAIVDSIQCNGKCIACINEPGTKVKPEKIRMKDLKESFQSKSDLSRIVKKVINEQWWFEVLNNSWGPDIPMGDVNLTRTLSEKERFKMLFDWAKTWPSTGSDWNSIKSYAVNMKNEMSGMGSGNVLNYLRKINTKAKFAALCKNFNYDGSNLYDWFSGEWTIGWGDIMDIIPIEIKTGVPKKAVNSTPLYN